MTEARELRSGCARLYAEARAFSARVEKNGIADAGKQLQRLHGEAVAMQAAIKPAADRAEGPLGEILPFDSAKVEMHVEHVAHLAEAALALASSDRALSRDAWNTLAGVIDDAAALAVETASRQAVAA